MNLPWDKSYFKLSFYTIFTFICIYTSRYLIDALVYSITNMVGIYNFLIDIFAKLLSVFSVIIFGFVIAYVLSPLAEKLNIRLKGRNALATALTYLVIIVLLLILIAIICYSLSSWTYNDIQSLSDKFEGYRYSFYNIYNNAKINLSKMGLHFFLDDLDNIIEYTKSLFNDISLNAINNAKAFGEKLITLLLSVLVAFYFLKDRYIITVKIKECGKLFLNKKIYKYLSELIVDIDEVFSGYIRGQLTDGIIMASLISLALAIVKVPFPILIGIITGFLNIIPYIGCLLGLVLAIILSFVGGEPIRALYAVIIILCLQQLDTVLISPKIVGNSVKLSPVIIIISLTIGGKLFGIVGLILVVPIVAVVKKRFDKFYIKKSSVNSKLLKQADN